MAFLNIVETDIQEASFSFDIMFPEICWNLREFNTCSISHQHIGSASILWTNYRWITELDFGILLRNRHDGILGYSYPGTLFFLARVWRLQGSIQDIEISMQDLECSRQVSSSFCYPSSHNHRSKKMGPSNSSYWILEIPTTSSTFSFQPTILVGIKKTRTRWILGFSWDFSPCLFSYVGRFVAHTFPCIYLKSQDARITQKVPGLDHLGPALVVEDP